MIGTGLTGSGSITSPIAVDVGVSYTSVGVGYADAGTVVATRADGSLYTWGWNNSGTQWTLNPGAVRNVPTLLETSQGWNRVTLNVGNTVIGFKGTNPFTWGAATNGASGQGFSITYSSPVQLGSLPNINTLSPVQIASGSWSQISAGNQYTFARDVNNNIYAWGQDNFGQLGL
jgi:alpha-tubulin suppressor-like RCC1 family protein